MVLIEANASVETFHHAGRAPLFTTARFAGDAVVETAATVAVASLNPVVLEARR